MALDITAIFSAITSSLVLYLVKLVLQLDKRLSLFEKEIEYLKARLDNYEKSLKDAR
jgi:uncharacterized small protein (DUF1192 family)